MCVCVCSSGVVTDELRARIILYIITLRLRVCARRTAFRSGPPSGQGRTANPRRRVKTFWRPGTGRYGVLALPFRRRRRRPGPAAARPRHRRRRLAAALRPLVAAANRCEPLRILFLADRSPPPPSPTRFRKERGRWISISNTALSVSTTGDT